MYELIKKTYSAPILNQTVIFKQATLIECIEYSFEISRPWFKLDVWIFNFLKDNWIKLKHEDLIKVNLELFMDTIHEKRFKDFFEKKNNKKFVAKSSMPYEAYIVKLAEHFKTDPISLINTYTPTQIKYLTDWITWNINEETSEGRRKNIISKEMKEMDDESNTEEDLEDMNELLARMDKKKGKK